MCTPVNAQPGNRKRKAYEYALPVHQWFGFRQKFDKKLAHHRGTGVAKDAGVHFLDIGQPPSRHNAVISENQYRCRDHRCRLSILSLSSGSDLDLDCWCRSPEQVAVEVVAFVVDHDEGGEVFDLDTPDGLHAVFLVLLYFDLLDAVVRKARGRTADRAEVESAVLLAGVMRARFHPRG